MILYNNVLQKYFKYTCVQPLQTNLWSADKSLTYYVFFLSTAQLGKTCQCLDVVEQLKEEKLNATEKPVCYLIFFVTWLFILKYWLNVYGSFVFFIFWILCNINKAYFYQCVLVSMFWNT